MSNNIEELKKENERLREEIEKLKKENKELKDFQDRTRACGRERARRFYHNHKKES